MTQIRLNSVVPNGVSGPEAAVINVLYEFLLNKYHQDAYSYISINQIGDEFDEVFRRDGKKAYLNIRYPSPENFDKLSDNLKNQVRMEVLHSGLVIIAEKEGKFKLDVLEKIRRELLSNNFCFDITCKIFSNKKNKSLRASLILRPTSTEFIYSIQIQKDGVVICSLPIYKGATSGSYANDLFGMGKWNGDSHLILSGKAKEVEIHIKVGECIVVYKNLTAYNKSPLFEMFRTDISDMEKKAAVKDFEHSLPPAILGIIKKSDN